MKNIFKKTFIVLLSAIIIFAGTAPVSNAASKHMIIVNTKKNTLNYYVNYTLVKKFRCATGKASTPTPQRKTTIVNKIKNRPFYKTGIPGGDPRNPLGKRWMGLNIDGTQGSTYGIHGNNNEKSIGKNVSHGCIRMHNSEVEWLFDQVPLGTVVLIKNTSNSDNYIANYYNVKLLQSGWFTENKKTYYRKSNGQLAKGWTKIDGKTYYFGKSKGQLYTGWATIGGNKYYLGTDGAIRTGWQTIGENKYYFNSKGVMTKGWATIDGNKYYFGKISGKLATGWTTISGKKYYFGTDGVKQTGWITVGSNKYYLGTDGVRRTGWRTIDGNRYYFGKSSGQLYTGWATIGGKKYYLGTDGVMVTGKQTINGVVYEFGKDGVLKGKVEEQDKEPDKQPENDQTTKDNKSDNEDNTKSNLENNNVEQDTQVLENIK
ncbi:N-acetylmuramoyl-L-alanine amidase family protein [Intestinibacter bartlettii]|uniref:L,D-transpeptidase family protein n=1 Tax=Intestinibacter bartlettii TaxID=261299 RepID=A0ABS8CX50_9FIRM|nr:L,D-transpeptidase family protein [Intestinibacter bartlettii]MCB5397239.1 L,D-transpeptidase family protein [Intestinibacter bartlettii]MCB5403788.1 L,D-transpeptidase family protein [Intestinibacter bartlettii]MCB5446046.1 L,D-transpeptidase family protein [Intestinibacter bartlettii]MCB5748638.1 L,D-transpeptidase family protein [Intestinibacter bartlettii]